MKKTTLTKIAVGLFAAASVNAFAAVNVGGVVWNPNSGFDFTSQGSIFEKSVDVGGTLNGIGNVQTLNNTTVNTFCPGCELTFEFGGFFLDPSFVTAGATPNTTTIGFTGGWIKIYVDSTPDFDADSKASATDGTLWLDLVAYAQPQTTSAGVWLTTLFGDIATGTLGSGNDKGSGAGLFDVVGGIAAGNFNTDTVVATDGHLADFSFSSSYQPNPNNYVTPDGFGLFGTGELKGNSIPEPASLMLSALGIAGLGVARRRSAK
jgi:hypothetical protein